jgi:hypothetical protein
MDIYVEKVPGLVRAAIIVPSAHWRTLRLLPLLRNY